MTRIAHIALITIASGVFAMTSPAFASPMDDLSPAPSNVTRTEASDFVAMSARPFASAVDDTQPIYVARTRSESRQALRRTSTKVAQTEQHPSH